MLAKISGRFGCESKELIGLCDGVFACCSLESCRVLRVGILSMRRVGLGWWSDFIFLPALVCRGFRVGLTFDAFGFQKFKLVRPALDLSTWGFLSRLNSVCAKRCFKTVLIGCYMF